MSNFIKTNIDASGLKDSYSKDSSVFLDSVRDRFDGEKDSILKYIGSSGNTLNIFDSWLNRYEVGYGSDLHTHDQVGTPEYSDYTIIIFLELNDKENLMIMGKDEIMQNISPEVGDAYIIHNSVLHGLSPVKGIVYALMLRLNR